jgi:hypothetical protein
MLGSYLGCVTRTRVRTKQLARMMHGRKLYSTTRVQPLSGLWLHDQLAQQQSPAPNKPLYLLRLCSHSSHCTASLGCRGLYNGITSCTASLPILQAGAYAGNGWQAGVILAPASAWYCWRGFTGFRAQRHTRSQQRELARCTCSGASPAQPAAAVCSACTLPAALQVSSLLVTNRCLQDSCVTAVDYAGQERAVRTLAAAVAVDPVRSCDACCSLM